MKIRNLLPGLLLFLGLAMQAQEKKALSLDEAISLATTKSTEAGLADTRVTTSKLDVDNVKNNVYPDFKVSGQYMRITNPTVKFKIPLGNDEPADPGDGSGGSTASPSVNQIMFAQASLSMPIFSGFKLRNSIDASENIYKAQTFNAANTKEQLAMQAIMLYVNLYKAEQSIALIQENLKSADQRVTDFTAMEQNGLLARNDLLKAQLQSSNIQLTLDDARKKAAVINYQLVTLLKLPEGTQVVTGDAYFKNAQGITPTATEAEAIAQRSDLEALRWQQKAAEANIKVAKGDYYPSLALSAGYVALDIQNVVQVYNAVNFGVGVSYDISGIFKNNKKVKAAQSRAEETRYQVALLTDRVKVQVQEALENYNLSLKQNKVYTEAVDQATENYRIVKDKYDNGLVDTNDLLEADVEQLQAKLNQAFSKADMTQRYYELLNASGKLTGSFNLQSNQN
ncbi:TolC family protein [Flavobacterium album]|uniref:TolC family protein n=1 Tax=Flavobacterium album TaxID=2175091 RepID=A0A2S1QYC7_9FLAO|nr:TolC family protein [Flavobacterium album]AWH85427.1 TolC family protein [Flavobacterium album]